MNKLCCFACLFFLFLSCKNKEIRTSLNSSEKVIFDSLNVLRAEVIRKKSDSLCLAMKDTVYNRAVDSMLSIRLLEIQNLVEDEK